jgi:signal transduction histidine kinase/ActR/RegA family two-component response regulator
MTRNASLRRRLVAQIVAGGVATSIVAAAGFSWLDLKRFRKSTEAEVAAIGAIVADQAAPAISLKDHKAAAEILNSLEAVGLIRDAVLYDRAGACFAVFHRAGAATCPPVPPDGVHRMAGGLVLAMPILEGGERIGALGMDVSVPSISAILRQYMGGAALILVLSLIVAAMLAVALEARVSGPILAIANVAKKIAETHRFEDRVRLARADELGVLAESFNTMLDEIGRRDAELSQHRRWLEEQVAERNRVNSELRVARDKAEEAARLKAEFLTNMSHEIRTPMNGVMGMIGLVLERTADPESREQLQVAQTAAQSLVTILNDILDLSKVEAGKMTLEALDFDLNALVEETLRIFEIAARQKNIGIGASVDPECPRWVRGDPLRLRQVLVNLVGNAVKFTGAGSVEIRASLGAAAHILFEVRDTGIGIPRAKLNAIFEPFTQADGSHTRRFGGTGLGLAISRRLAMLMGGRLWAESVEAAGSRFFVELPLAAAEGAQRPEPVREARHDFPPLHVLVAEDNAVNQKVIHAMLRRLGWTVTLAANGREAFERFLQEPFDLILMDVQMPVMDGLEAARLIREVERKNGHRIPIVALTAHAGEAQHKQCVVDGMDGVITKPVNLQSLLTGIGEAMPKEVRA